VNDSIVWFFFAFLLPVIGGSGGVGENSHFDHYR